MLTVASLTRPELERRLAGPGLTMRTGPFVSRIRSPLGQLAEGIALIKSLQGPKFDETVDVAVNIGIDPEHRVLSSFRSGNERQEPENLSCG